jgi:hypothetical protein
VRRLATVRWRTPPPTSIDEELAAYDDGTAWLAVRCSRDSASTIGTWSTSPSPDDHRRLVAEGDADVNLIEPGDLPETAERLRLAALGEPVATARFVAGRTDLAAVSFGVVAAGNRATELELDPETVSVHVEQDGATVTWFEASLETGFITPEADGLGGLRSRAVLAPGAFGALHLDVPGLAPYGAIDFDVVVRAQGWLANALPDAVLPERFAVSASSLSPGPR